MKKSKKTFDAVHMMRQLRDRLGEQCKDMTFGEQKQHIRTRLGSKPPRERPRVRTMPNDIEARFHQEMLSVFRKAKDECHFKPTRFLQMVSDLGGLQAAKALLHAEGYSEGLTTSSSRGLSFLVKTSWPRRGGGCENLVMDMPNTACPGRSSHSRCAQFFGWSVICQASKRK
jgi:hypothetical protein